MTKPHRSWSCGGWVVAAFVAVVAAQPGCGGTREELPPSSRTPEQTQAEINYPFGGAPADEAIAGPLQPPK